MAHPEQKEFVEKVKNRYPDMFNKKKVVDFGSLDINGSNKEHFTDCEYTGVDIGEGKNVDVISKCHEFESSDLFDVVITTEMLEHDMYWEKSLKKMVELLKKKGLLLITCATTGRPSHGHSTADPDSSPFTSAIPKWGTYYKNLTEEDIAPFLNPSENFLEFEHSVNEEHKDYQFWGIKN